MKRFAGTAFWTFFDQAVCSLTTAVLSIVVGRSVSPHEFGAFGIAFLVFTLLVGLSRAMVTDPMVVVYSGGDDPARADATSKATALSTAFGLGTGLVTVLVGLAFGYTSTLGASLITLGVSLPGLLQQDAWRYAFFMARRARPVAVNDTVRAIVMFALLAALFARDRVTVPVMILTWGLSAYVAAFLGVLQSRIIPRARGALAWWQGHRELSLRLGADFGINQGAANGATMAVGPVSSLAAVGALNASRTLMGPLTLLFSGMTALVMPAMSARIRESLTRIAGIVAIALGSLAAVWMLFLMVMPEAWGLWLLKENWAGAKGTILPTGVGMVCISMAIGPNLGLKARALGNAVLRVTVVQAPLLVVLGTGGAALADAPGAAWGFAAAQAVGLALTWREFLAAERHHAPEVDETVELPRPAQLPQLSEVSELGGAQTRGAHQRPPRQQGAVNRRVS